MMSLLMTIFQRLATMAAGLMGSVVVMTPEQEVQITAGIVTFLLLWTDYAIHYVKKGMK